MLQVETRFLVVSAEVLLRGQRLPLRHDGGLVGPAVEPWPASCGGLPRRIDASASVRLRRSAGPAGPGRHRRPQGAASRRWLAGGAALESVGDDRGVGAVAAVVQLFGLGVERAAALRRGRVQRLVADGELRVVGELGAADVGVELHRGRVDH